MWANKNENPNISSKLNISSNKVWAFLDDKYTQELEKCFSIKQRIELKKTHKEYRQKRIIHFIKEFWKYDTYLKDNTMTKEQLADTIKKDMYDTAIYDKKAEIDDIIKYYEKIKQNNYADELKWALDMAYKSVWSDIDKGIDKVNARAVAVKNHESQLQKRPWNWFIKLVTKFLEI